MIQDFNIVLDAWAETVPTNSASQQIEEAKFVADSVAICRQLPFRMIAMCLYGTMLTDEVSTGTLKHYFLFCIANNISASMLYGNLISYMTTLRSTHSSARGRTYHTTICFRRQQIGYLLSMKKDGRNLIWKLSLQLEQSVVQDPWCY